MAEDVPTDARRFDEFGRPVALNINNIADLAGHYPYSPERFRVFVDGDRQFIQYDGEPAQYTDVADSHVLKPQSDGEVVTLETTEIFRYAVQYVLEWSAAMETTQPLQSGDVVTLGYGDADLDGASDDSPGPAADGWFFVWDSGLDAGEVRLAQYRSGTEQDATVVPVEQAITDWTRRAAETNWYAVGATRFVETYTTGGVQRNPEIGGVSEDDGKGPSVGNHPLQASVKAGAAGAGALELDVGSMGIRYLGDLQPILRRKTHQFTATVDATGAFVALDAIRVAPDRSIVNLQLTDVSVVEFGGDGDVVVIAQSFAPSKLADANGNAIVDADFSTPVEHSAQGSVVETTAAVDRFPDADGTVQTDGQATNPGGYQEGYASLATSGQGSTQHRTQAGQQAKREVNGRDVVVFLGRAGATGDVTVNVTTEQQW